MKQLVLNIPDFVDLDEKEVTMLLATKLYEEAAELVCLSKRAFAELLGKYHASLFNYPSSDLSKNVKNA